MESKVHILLLQANTAEGAFASPISNSEGTSGAAADTPPPSTAAAPVSGSEAGQPLPFGSPSDPPKSSQPLRLQAAHGSIQQLPSPAASPMAPVPPSPAMSDTTAAAVLLDLASASDRDPEGVLSPVLEASVTQPSDTSTQIAAAPAADTLPADAGRLQPNVTVEPSEGMELVQETPPFQANTVQNSRLRYARPQSAPPAVLERMCLPTCSHDLLAEAVTSVTGRSQSEEPSQAAASVQTCGLTEDAVTPLPHRRVATLSGALPPAPPPYAQVVAHPLLS